MTTRLTIICFIAFVTFACIDEENENQPGLENATVDTSAAPDTAFHKCDSVAIATSTGTTCCVSGPMLAKPGDTFRYHYQINRSNPEVYWEILEGDMVITGGQNTQTVTVTFGPDFTSGWIQGRAKGNPLDNQATTACEEAVNISSH